MSNKKLSITQVLLMFFGIFMVFFYLGLAVLLAKGFLGVPKYLSWFFAVAFGAYGLFRGYRVIKGEDIYCKRRNDDEEPKYQSYAERLKELENNEDENEK